MFPFLLLLLPLRDESGVPPTAVETGVKLDTLLITGLKDELVVMTGGSVGAVGGRKSAVKEYVAPPVQVCGLSKPCV
jgi:hypothetical protein